VLVALVSAALAMVLSLMRGELGTTDAKVKFSQMFATVQASAPSLMRGRGGAAGRDPDGRSAAWLAFGLAALPAAIATALAAGLDPAVTLVVGLIVFGGAFALNSAVHSFLILDYARGDKVAMNVGFYSMANAAGRLGGTVFSGLIYQWQGLQACLWASTGFILAAGALSLMLPARPVSVRSVAPRAG
jgi:predicted MFS family arabinose efflux permease